MAVRWEGFDEMQAALDLYEQTVLNLVRRTAEFWQPIFESYAKQFAPWIDQTGNARQSLHAWVEELSNDVVRLYLGHGVEYGVYLETKYAGRYAIIWPTIQAHLEAVRQMIQGIFR